MKTLVFLSALFPMLAPAAGVQVPNFPCSALPECVRCEKTVEALLVEDKQKNSAGFVSRCQAECGNRCGPEHDQAGPRGQSSDEG